jgi:hypothetical protein
LGAAGVEGGVEEVRRGYAERLEGLPEPELLLVNGDEDMVFVGVGGHEVCGGNGRETRAREISGRYGSLDGRFIVETCFLLIM